MTERENANPMPVVSKAELCHEAVCKVQAFVRRSYEVALAGCLTDSGVAKLAGYLRNRSAMLVTTPTVGRLYGEALSKQLQASRTKISLLVLPCDENSKSLSLVERICEEAHRHSLDRNSVLIGLGGGVCTDLVGMAASWLHRGIRHIRIPTTLIGQVDAGIGIKGSVNFMGKKSSLGCFYPPETALIDPCFLHSLDSIHLSSGLAEVVKVALVRDPLLFELVERYQTLLLQTRFAEPQQAASEIIWRSVLGMLSELESNLYEDRTYKRLVDFGHTFSPLLEELSGFTLSHGEAVAVDMTYCCFIASELGMLPAETRDRILDCLRAAHLPCRSRLLTEEICMKALERAAGHRGGAVNLVLLSDIGRAFFVEHFSQLPRNVLRSALSKLNLLTTQTSRQSDPLEQPVSAELASCRSREGGLVSSQAGPGRGQV
jgi:3-dehydroquinate synthetase